VSEVSAHNEKALAAWKRGEAAVWLRPETGARPVNAAGVTAAEVADAAARLLRFRPALRSLFPQGDWDGGIRSPLLEYPSEAPAQLLVKADHALPLTGSIKARGGVYELLFRIERIALAEGLLRPGDDYAVLAGPEAAAALSRHKILVASTGNLGFSIGLVARAFGLVAEIHMSSDAKAWKKDRLRALGAVVVEHDCDYTETVARAREAAAAGNGQFIDDETSRELLLGYATAADELIAQLAERGLVPSAERPLVVYLPCGVGGAPAGVTFGLKSRLGSNVFCIFVEPVASACVFAAMAAGGGEPVSVYAFGLDNVTMADGLAVPVASALALDVVGGWIDAVVAVPEQAMLDWVRRAWRDTGLRLEPSAAAALAAVAPYRHAAAGLHDAAIHVAWTTGGSLLPEAEFQLLLRA
jgi:D-serine dehydratase